jgi:hypothetical protein
MDGHRISWLDVDLPRHAQDLRIRLNSLVPAWIVAAGEQMRGPPTIPWAAPVPARSP